MLAGSMGVVDVRLYRLSQTGGALESAKSVDLELLPVYVGHPGPHFYA